MEDDDEFGDLYTDVLRPFSSSSAPQPHQSSSNPASFNPSIDLNTHSDDEDFLYVAPKSNSTISHKPINQTLVPEPQKPPPELGTAQSRDSGQNFGGGDVLAEQGLGKGGDFVGGSKNWAPDSLELGGSRVLESGDVKLPDGASEDDKSGVDAGRGGGGDKDVDFMEKDVNFDIEEVDGEAGDVGLDPIIPGLSATPAIPSLDAPVEPQNREKPNVVARDDASGQGDDWDSDSEDDLQIVLNDNNHGPMAAERNGVMGSDDEDEDGDPLVIVADGDQTHPPLEEQEWGEDTAVDGERKEGADAAKVNGAIAGPPKIGYSSHGYHPFHSQFKYVRPGAAPIPGAAAVVPGGTPGQVRPLANIGPVAGRGRGDWRPAGIKSAPPMQKNFHSGFGAPAWGGNMAGRGFGGGLEFTLPSHKTIFDVDIDSFEEKPWRHPGVDISDFFNFGFNEESWKQYCKQLEQLRLEATMQSKIRVYESGRTEQEYDPDLPPELAAAVGIHDASAENANLGKADVGPSDLAKASARVRPPIPTGRAIQVEGGCGERLPSVDTRPPRVRDSDAIIEITLQGSLDDDSPTGNGAPEPPDNDLPREDLRGGNEVEDDAAQEDTEYFDSFSTTYSGRNRELAGRSAPFMNSLRDDMPGGDGILPFPPEAPVQYRPGSRGQDPVHPGGNFGTPHEDRRLRGRAHGRSPHMTPIQSTRDNRFLDSQKEESVESMDVKGMTSSPVRVAPPREPSVENKDAVHDEIELADGVEREELASDIIVTTDTSKVGNSVQSGKKQKLSSRVEQPPPQELDGGIVLADGTSGMEREELTSNTMTSTDALKDENLISFGKKQKLSSRVEQPPPQELDGDEDLKATRSSENSKARSESSRDLQKWHDGVEEEVIEDGSSVRMGNSKRHLDEDEQSFRRKDRDGRQEMERSRMVVKGREDTYPHRDWDSIPNHHSHVKTDSFDRRKERDSSDGGWQRRDDDLHSRRIRPEDARKQERGDEMGSRHRSKVRESERSNKDELLHSRKLLDNGSWRGHQDKDMGSRHRERDDNLKSRYGNLDDLHGKRRKDEEYLRRDHAEKEEILHSHRESSSHRKRERDDVLDQRKRDDQPRIRDNLDDHHSVRHKDEGWMQRERGERQREREEWHRLRQPHEENLSKREREEGRGAVRSGRGAEDKAWVSHARGKDEYKGSDKDYQFKDTGRRSEQLKRRDRVEDESFSHHRGREDVYARGSQFSNEERRSRQERSSARNDHSANASDHQRVHDKKHKENTRKNKESEGADISTLGPSKRNQEDHNSQRNETVCSISGHESIKFRGDNENVS
ncbi:hypothetical protein PVL29_014572 [Vitis rotundifolia]|uniref:Pre-mRNA polyadenylation factor Fip1 domain-containing protein n=1 Tax=Vitis rotundifolia TaxID=103349 RepID=A0AA38ZHG5_VITRO|nr:hypothetical protein PVL29_014572 [Vitis rotundifolia]